MFIPYLFRKHPGLFTRKMVKAKEIRKMKKIAIRELQFPSFFMPLWWHASKCYTDWRKKDLSPA